MSCSFLRFCFCFRFHRRAPTARLHCSGILFGTALSILLASLPAAGALNDSGQTQCYNAVDGIATCNDAVTGDTSSRQRQDARFGRDAAAAAGVLTKTGGGEAGFDFTKISNAGNVLPAAAALGINPGDWACTQDNVTGLVWEVKPDDAASPRHKDATYTWGNTAGGNNCSLSAGSCNTDAYVAAVNAAGLCGYIDWRLPARRELLSIVHYGRYSPSPVIDPAWFPNTASSGYWSGEAYVLAPVSSWGIDFDTGAVDGDGNTTEYRVRLVRGAAMPVAAFVDHGDGTVTDSTTGLMWMKCSRGQGGANCTAGSATGFSWADALGQAVTANTANELGYSDWRLPGVKELESLIDVTRSGPAIDTAFFPNTPQDQYWSSTTYSFNPAAAWLVAFFDGDVGYTTKTIGNRVRLVRGGQAFDLLVVNTLTLNVTATGATDALLTVTADRASTGYWLVLPAGSPKPAIAELAAGASGSLAANTAESFGLSGLVPDTAYDLWFVALAGGKYNAIQKTSFTMPSATPAPPSPPSPPSPPQPPQPSTCSVVDGALLGSECVYSVSQGAENVPMGFCIAAGETVTVSIDGAYYQLGADTPTACFEVVASGRPAYSGTGPGRGLLPVSGNARVTAVYPDSVLIVARNGDIVTALTGQAGIRTRVNADCASLSAVKNGGEIAAPAWLLTPPPAAGCPADALTPAAGAFAAAGTLACPKGENLAMTGTFRRLSLAPTFAPRAGQRMYFVARLPATDGSPESWFQLAASGWQPLTAPIAAAGTAPGGETSPWVLRYLDIGGLPSGTELYLGHGDDADEMSANRRYCGFFRLAP